MKTSVKNKLRMYRSVESVLTLNAGSWTGLPAFESAATAFSQKLVLLIAAGNTQNTLTSGISRHKQELRLSAAKALKKIANILRAYAMDNGLIELNDSMKITYSRLAYSIPVLQHGTEAIIRKARIFIGYIVRNVRLNNKAYFNW